MTSTWSPTSGFGRRHPAGSLRILAGSDPEAVPHSARLRVLHDPARAGLPRFDSYETEYRQLVETVAASHRISAEDLFADISRSAAEGVPFSTTDTGQEPSPPRGRKRLGDLREGKRTLMLLHLLAAAPDDRRWLETFLSEPDDAREAQAERVYDMMQDYGSIGFADQFARGIADLAVVAFDRAFAGVPDSDARRFIRHLVAYMIERDR